jgi:hypothetical protein
VKLEVARDEATAHGSEGRKIAMTTNPHVMPSSLISTTVGSSKIASSRKCVAKTSCKKKRQMMLQFDGEEVVELCPMMQQEQTMDPFNMRGLQKKIPVAMKEE